ncbi:SMC-Scp complex subunit ScpB [Anatilimnocola floriformis]|uniref:SMC-Scp complex subunit ScpB n=1 Tax=Anatilimnocola floriformis TaxID=2948575 RepID=UPI0020C1C7F6|nr:SMC-Scp complex subunit ScpB [Anatilimnocola floriformis]
MPRKASEPKATPKKATSKSRKEDSPKEESRKEQQLRPPRILAIEETDPSEVAESLGLEQFADPDDAGLSLEELGQAYAALMTQGTDPYEATAPPPEPTAGAVEGEAAPAAATDDEPLEVIAGDDERSAEVTPQTILEAMLFVGHPLGEPLTSQQIASLMRGVRAAEIDELVQELNEGYERDGSVYHITSAGAGYRLQLRAEWGPIRDRFYGRVKEARLSQSSVDVLAIVAYQQPISADEVERLRGKPSGAVLSQLVRRDLLGLNRPEPKAAPLYHTTARFLDLFGLDDLDELPQSLEGEKGL